LAGVRPRSIFHFLIVFLFQLLTTPGINRFSFCRWPKAAFVFLLISRINRYFGIVRLHQDLAFMSVSVFLTRDLFPTSVFFTGV
jgi:hypothetical protein